jgi:hypothetical protein
MRKFFFFFLSVQHILLKPFIAICYFCSFFAKIAPLSLSSSASVLLFCLSLCIPQYCSSIKDMPPTPRQILQLATIAVTYPLSQAASCKLCQCQNRRFRVLGLLKSFSKLEGNFIVSCHQQRNKNLYRNTYLILKAFKKISSPDTIL